MKRLLIFMLALRLSLGQYVVNYYGDEKPDSNELLGRNKCTFGPDFWCQNLESSSKCPGSTKFCSKRIWPDLKLEEDNDDVCTVCKKMVKEARDQLLSNETQTELKEVLEGSCALLPIKLVRKECDKIADKLLPNLVDALASRMDPQQVCHVSGLCNDFRIDVILKSVTSCPKFIGNLKKSKVIDTMLYLCGTYAGSYSDGCIQAVLENQQDLYEAVANEEICDLVQVDDDLECDFCETLVDKLKSTLLLNSTKEEFNTVLHNLCKKTKVYQQECENFVNNYADNIYTLVEDALNGQELCRRLGICKTTEELKKELVWTIVKLEDPSHTLQASDSDSNEDDPESTASENSTEQTENDNGNLEVLPTCSMCEFTVGKLINYLAGNKTREGIEDAMEYICDHFPSSKRDKCQTFMDDYGDKLIEILVTEGSAKAVCEALHLCLFEALRDDNTKCILCEYVINAVKQRLGNNSTEEEIKQELEAVCDRYGPQRYRKKCDQLVEMYGDELIEYLASEMDADEICAELKLCKNNDCAKCLNVFCKESEKCRVIKDEEGWQGGNLCLHLGLC